MFEVLRGMSEKLSSCHMDVVHKFHDIIKDLGKYLDEQKSKHKQVSFSMFVFLFLSSASGWLQYVFCVCVKLCLIVNKYVKFCFLAVL